MQHSVRLIGNVHEEVSEKRKEKHLFKSAEFFEFAKLNKNKYSLTESEGDLFVSTWNSEQLIEDFKKTVSKN